MTVIYLKDTLGRFILVNRRFETLFHVDRDELIGKTDYDIFSKEVAETFRDNDRRVLKTGTSLLGDRAVDATITRVEALNFWKSRLPLLTEFLNTCQM